MTSAEDQERTSRGRYEELVELSPSAKYIYTTLQDDGTLTKDELAERTLLPDRTVSYALQRLVSAGLVERQVDASDARYRRYSSVSVTYPDGHYRED